MNLKRKKVEGGESEAQCLSPWETLLKKSGGKGTDDDSLERGKGSGNPGYLAL